MSAPDHEEHIHMPSPSIWPFIVVAGIGMLPLGGVLLANPAMLGEVKALASISAATQRVLAMALLGGGTLLILFAGMGWITSVIREKYDMDIAWGNRVLSMGWKLFLVSEAAIFGSFFAHYFYTLYHIKPGGWPPAGTPHLNLMIPMMGTLILVTSSFTCEFGHKALLAGKRGLCKSWLMVTLILGFVFMTLQSWEWGHLIAKYGFTPTTNIFGTHFYLITGFHGAHVITGLLLLALVYARLEMGSFDRTRHFSLNAASWYWHFVDVIWVFVFLLVYVVTNSGL